MRQNIERGVKSLLRENYIKPIKPPSFEGAGTQTIHNPIYIIKFTLCILASLMLDLSTSKWYTNGGRRFCPDI